MTGHVHAEGYAMTTEAHPRAQALPGRGVGDVSSGARLLRAGAAATLTTGASLVAHALGGGHVASAPAVLVLGAITFSVTLMIATGLAGRRMRAPHVIGLVVSGQAAFHCVLSLVPHHALSSSIAPGGHHHHAAPPALDAALPSVQAATHSMTTPMVTAHLLAALVVGLGVLYGERAFWVLHDGLLRSLVLGRDDHVVLPTSGRRVTASQAPRPVGFEIAALPGRRAPPVCSRTIVVGI